MKVNRILIGLVIVLLLVAIIAFISVSYYMFHLNKDSWGSVSDWVSTGCNVVMAAAAGYAAYNAKGWII